MKTRCFLGACGVLAAVAGSAFAAPVTFSFTLGTRAAEAKFEKVGTELEITLTNTSTFDVLDPTEIVTAVFWDISGSALSLGRVSGLLAGGSVVHFGPDGGGVIGGEYGYKSGLIGAPHGAAYGIASAGFGLFGPGDVFPGPDLDPPGSPDGLNYGLTSAGDILTTGIAPVTGGNPLIQNSVVFRLSGLPTTFDESMISNVSIQYGTGLDEPNLPAPGGLAALALAGMLGARRRRA